MDDNKIIVTDDQGKELIFEILFTFDHDGNKYVLYYDPEQEDGEVFASKYSEDGTLNPIDSKEEWDMVEEVFDSFVLEEEKEPVFETCDDESCITEN